MHWLHYVGGFYSPAKFIAEARGYGVARRVSPSIAHSMTYGDVVTLLSWRGGKPVAFAEFLVSRVTMQTDVAQEVGQQFAQEGKAHEVEGGGGGLIARECGSYTIEATYVVEAPLAQVVEKAVEAATELGIKCSFMVGGLLTQVFDPPDEVDAPFTRGFIKAEGEGQPIIDPRVVGIEGYTKRERKQRLDLQFALGI